MAEQDDPELPNKKLFAKKAADQPGTAPEVEDVPADGPEDGQATADESDKDSAVQRQDDQDDGAADTDDAGSEVTDSENDAKAASAMPGRGGRFKRFLSKWWGSPKARWITIGVVVIVLAAVFAVPFTRYNVLGLVLSTDVTVQAVDSKTGKPVSGATVRLAGKTAETNGEGIAVLHVHAGSKKLVVSKKYYTGTSGGKLVALGGNTFKASLVALGRQVNIKVVNSITGKPVAAVLVSAQGATAKTNANGQATLVVPSGADMQSASMTLSGYNTAKVTITAAGDLAKNTFRLAPTGKLYFLSNLSGRIDVVKTNLDGSDREVVLEGTGTEDKYSTSLLASRDWKYLALLSKRSGQNASIYLIDTTKGDNLTTIDEGDADFSLVGWSGDRFIYQVTRSSVALWQPHRYALKSFDPASGHTLLLDQTDGSGTGTYDYANQSFGGVYLIADQVVYVKNWQGNGNAVLGSRQAELDTIGADGSGHKVVKGFTSTTPLNGYGYASLSLDARLYEPDGLYVRFLNNDNDYYHYDDGKITADNTLTDNTFYSDTYPTYLLSPTGSSNFWADQRDGKNVLFVGDKDAKNQKQIASLTDYNTYGWFTDDYLLVSKNSSELYIMSAAGGDPVKITDYYKPAINYNGYGGGYGGL